MTNEQLPPPVAGTAVAVDDEPPTRSPAVLVSVGLIVAVVLLAAAAVPVLRSGDGGDAASAAPTPTAEPMLPPTTVLELRPLPTEPETTATDPDSAAAEVDAEPSGSVPVDTEPAADPEPVDTDPSEPDTTEPAASEPASTEPEPSESSAGDGEPADPDVAESKAVVRGGQIFLEGAVPTAEAGEEIAALAAEILGPDNVFNNYVVDPRAGDPNLGNITVEDTINFATGSAVILPEAEGLLNQALALMTIRPSVTVVVVGHTDDRGSDEYNQALSVQRAEAVKTWLTDRGIDGDRLTVVGKGESEPIADNTTDEGRRLNRRIQFFLENLLVDSTG